MGNNGEGSLVIFLLESDPDIYPLKVQKRVILSWSQPPQSHNAEPGGRWLATIIIYIIETFIHWSIYHE